ncbi:MAG: 30S ribosomal protein S20 [Planctomycetes bacterium]|nr:30S ribosomal protein S20 [Planctomycetota bacterium]
MAHSLSAKKRIRQNTKARARNRWRKDQIKQVVREFDDAVKANDKAKATEQLKAVFSTLDKVASKNTIHKNAASRQKARLSKRLAKLA